MHSILIKAAIGKGVLYLTLILLTVICIIPLWLVVSTSLTSENALTLHGYGLIPQEFSLDAYRYIWNDSKQLLDSYKITILVTVLGTISALCFTSLLSYPLSRKDFVFRNPFSFYIFFTMLFNGGLVPFYILVSQYLHLKDTIWALIIPYLVQPFYVLLMRTFFATIPDSLIESAKIDGAGELYIFSKIIVPLSTPVLATVGLFISLIYWNDWYLGLLFIEDRKLLPLQYLLMTLMTNIEVMSSNLQASAGLLRIPAETARMAMAVLAIGPIACIYMFFQKYFVRGLTVGAVKG
ncbi:carbohydrate ABC transporter permease [Paenibacillus eucommiae]|uniref:Aldouronate transport system permease protein n=1 Tax=Paenibacillus eucommiae TaxID=1355755 RepID=A0ABS4J3R8_9BACL|nr:carbohydrate ABC transporter permease [Paenibacillus eucommiae]MBP1994490.1 putative aldouronate transport system permease protein [Paenibacillus eucommiae]